jgi:outer membrane receptor protein involved in Fe transport
VTDQQGGIVQGAEVIITSVETNITSRQATNNDGLYVLSGLRPGRYRISVTKGGFQAINLTDVVLNVQDSINENFKLKVGSASESLTVVADRINIDTTDASISTVVDRNFAENLPMNGRSLQTLINLTPGVALVSPGAAGGADTGQFSINGQRAASNYWTVDGVSANVGSSALLGGNGVAGAVGTTSVLGGTNSLVSVDALQEFRIQTSTFAPEFGRTPGGQISILTRSGTNQIHGSVFEYLRNDLFDASNWFNGYTNDPPVSKAEERQNDFGGTLSGPIREDRAFFFFTYEGLRLRLPTTVLTQVPDLNARTNALPALRPYLNAFPFDPKQPDLGNGVAQFNASFSNPATLDAYSLRVDDKLGERLTIFGRYNYSPSELRDRGNQGAGDALSVSQVSRITVQTATLGSTWTLSTHSANELRFNYSRTNSGGSSSLDNFGGAVPLSSLGFPAPYTEENSRLSFNISSLLSGGLDEGQLVRNLQRQWNLVDNVSLLKGTHNLRFGIDYRRLTPVFSPFLYWQDAVFSDLPSAEIGSSNFTLVQTRRGATFLFRNLGVFAQDTWRVVPRLTLTYGLRWDTDFAPTSLDGPALLAATGFNFADLSHLGIAPAGTPLFKTRYGNVAPRLGLTFDLSQKQHFDTVLRGGFGVFYDLVTSEGGNVLNDSGYPFGSAIPPSLKVGGPFPLSSAGASPPPITPPTAANPGAFSATDPNLNLPYTLEWNVAVEQSLGEQQSLSTAYVGSVGRRLLQSTFLLSPSPILNPAFSYAALVTNSATSDYNALQVQFKRRMQRGLQILSSYTWAHSIDTASAGSVGAQSNGLVLGGNNSINRGPSDFDIRQAFSTGLTYTIPAPKARPFINVLARGWSLQSIIQVHTATPLTVVDGNFSNGLRSFAVTIRPDVTPGIPLYLYGAQCTAANGGIGCPGGKAINFMPDLVAGGCPDGSQSVGPFCPPPADANGNPIRQGTLGRNGLRGFGLTQWDFAVHRDFPIYERLTLQFRAELFNLFNHPNFGPPQTDLTVGQFGLSTQMLGQYLGGGLGGGSGAFNSLYQVGGPRSVQFGLKLNF